ncbi:unnamed protein product, partial [Arabidopsis halleri]
WYQSHPIVGPPCGCCSHICPRFRCSCLSVREGVIEVSYRATPWMLFPHMPTL